MKKIDSRNFKYIALLMLFIATSTSAATKKSNSAKWGERMARSEMKRFAQPWMIENATKPRWGYTHGLVVKAMLETWKSSGEKAYYNYAKIYADSLIDARGKIKMDYLSFNLDNVNPGKILFDFYALTKDQRYKTAMDRLRKQLKEQPRTSEGGYWHKLKYTHQMWLDGLFMATPFLAQYGATFEDKTAFADVLNQISLINKKTYDSKTGLYYHGWDESKEQAWANKVTGCSPNFWSRSIGWYAASLVDVLDYLPKETKGREKVLAIVRNLAATLIRYQDTASGVWYQVTDQGNRKGNYLESSASSMFVYFLSKSINKGYIAKSYVAPTTKAFNGLIKTFIKNEADGTITITNCCSVAGLGGDKVYRDGSFEYYIGEPVIENDPKSVGPFILASIQFEKLKR